VPSSAIAQNSGIWIRKRIKNGSSCASRKKPEVTIKPYDKVITKDAISDDGLFMVHRVDKKYYFEILISYWTRTCFWSADCRNYL
jgi:hypothetical protein